MRQVPIMASVRNNMITAIDVGANKTCCFIGLADDNGAVQVVGIGHQIAGGMNGGAVVAAGAVEMSIRGAVDLAENMAGQTTDQAVVGFAGGRPDSQSVTVEVAIAGHEVSDRDLDKAAAVGRAHHSREGREFLHVLPVGYALDGARGIRDPRSMFGSRLAVDLHLVDVEANPLHNLESCLNHVHLGMKDAVFPAYAAGLACLDADEMDQGVACIDMGAGTTSVALFAGGELVHAGVVPLGGQHVTHDIAYGLTTSNSYAERLKILHGNVLQSPSDDRECVDVPQIGEDEESALRIPRSMLIGIIRPRLDEIFEMLREVLDSSGQPRLVRRRAVLTGGACQLPGLGDRAASMLDMQVRLGRPVHVGGLAELTAGPAFSTCAGLLLCGARAAAQGRRGKHGGHLAASGAGPFGRVGRWLRENF